ncbi:hypothetical protein SEA_ALUMINUMJESUS_59 [Microbacterium phage AluminumJesus]|nr:hypothetical protein SEA_ALUMINUMJESUS_59 [Microbacterium phage AluminumJesus]
MSVTDEAKAAAEAEYPAVAVGDPIARVQRVPFAHGYQRGYECGYAARAQATVGEVRDILANLDVLNESGRMRHDDYSELHDLVSGLLP